MGWIYLIYSTFTNIVFLLVMLLISTSKGRKCDCMISSYEEMDRQTDKFSKGGSDFRGNYQICYSEDQPYGQVYDMGNDQCYNLLEQGPCNDGMLLVRDTTSLNYITCLPTCDTETLSKSEWKHKYRNRECTIPRSHPSSLDPIKK